MLTVKKFTVKIQLMLNYNELKVGTLFVKDGEPYEVLEYAFIRMQQRKPVAQLRIKNLITGKVQNYAAHQNETFKEAEVEIFPVKFIYQHQGEFWFQELNNPKNRFSLKSDILSKTVQYLKPDIEIKAFKFSNKNEKDRIINIELPIKMDFKVIEAPPAVRGNTAQGGTKTVILETGAKVNVPLFIDEGDRVRINTATGEYAERVKD